MLGGFLATDITLAAVVRVPDRVENVAHIAFAAGALAAFMYLQVSVGGDMMRRHLRAVSAVARFACPTCGHSLVGHLAGDEPIVRCPECASDVGLSTFEPPFPIPPRDRAFPPWRRSRSHPP